MPHGYVARMTPGEFAVDVGRLWNFCGSMNEPPILTDNIREFVDDYNSKKTPDISPETYILELYQLDSSRSK